MDFDSSSKFISSLAKFLQSLCNGYVEFSSGVEVIGHIYLNVDTGKKIDYILNEKVCKTDENSVTFISNSFHAQPAEKPKPPAKPAQTSDSNKHADSSAKIEDDIIIMEEPESKNVGTVMPRDNFQHQNTSSLPKPVRSFKRSFNQSFPSSQRHLAKQNRTEAPSGPNIGELETDALHSENNSTTNFLPPHLAGDTIMAATESDMSHLSKVFPQTFNDSANSHSNVEDRDVKPQLDSDLNVIQVKQEYDQSMHGGEEDHESFDDSQDQGGSFPGMPYDQYYSDGGKRVQRSDYSHMGGMSQGELFQGGAGPSIEGVAGDSSVSEKPHQYNTRRRPVEIRTSLLPIMDSFTPTTTQRAVCAKRPSAEVRYDGFGHLPVCIKELRQRCKLEGCKGQSRFRCIKCNLFLCCTRNKSCFVKFHAK